jgi:hypothetical protein
VSFIAASLIQFLSVEPVFARGAGRLVFESNAARLMPRERSIVKRPRRSTYDDTSVHS